jgi:glutathionylspermidine synthase
MLRRDIAARTNWHDTAQEYGFSFHTIDGQAYWDESAYYQFTLEQIENDIEDPTQELHEMCLHVVDKVVQSQALLNDFCIPDAFHEAVSDSWQAKAPSLYSRLDLVYDGTGPAKLLENNADTPTSLYESGFWQWLWLEQQVDSGALPNASDQFNSLQEKLIMRFRDIANHYQQKNMHFSCCLDSDEDRGTVQYLQDCAAQAGLSTPFVFIDDIGVTDTHRFMDLDNNPMDMAFKLYPWEFMLKEEFGEIAAYSDTKWVEPIWKSVLSNKALLPLLWEMFPNHPNLLPSYLHKDLNQVDKAGKWVKKPIFSREGANIMIIDNGDIIAQTGGEYGDEGVIFQQFTPLPKFADNYTLIGSWLVNDIPAGISVREDNTLITQDTSRFVPHIILG